MSRLGWYDRDGQPIDVERWMALRHGIESDYYRVAETTIGDVWVSTVWLGIDHNFAEVGPPLIFETMIFPECSFCERTPTQAAALAAHDQAVAYVQSGEYAAGVRQGES